MMQQEIVYKAPSDYTLVILELKKLILGINI
jgi:hypothetical protein